MQELEGGNFCYKPLFNAPPAPEVHELINQIKSAREVAVSVIQARIEEQTRFQSGFFGYIKSVLLMSDGSADEFTLEERKKVPLYLDFALQHLMDMFQITEVSFGDSKHSFQQNIVVLLLLATF